MTIQLKTIFGELILEGDFSCLADCVKAALAAKKSLSYANLSYANLSYANLRSANLSSANLSSANLSYADLSYADLSYANLSYANLRSANLRSANLSYANLSYANLSSANLSYANLRSANLSSADLSYADLSYANLSVIKHDLWAVIIYAVPEIPALRRALVEGRVNGSSYTGQCACLCGTIANERKTGVDNLGDLKPDGGRPAERFFLGINVGDTPDKSQFAKLAIDWIDEWTALTGLGKEAAK